MRTNGVTGDIVTVSGTYRNKYGKKIALEAGQSFPPCPKEGHSIQWEKVSEETRS
ncbi:MAG: hypothetical protein ACOYVK_00565 [Bacillota bacterium]